MKILLFLAAFFLLTDTLPAQDSTLAPYKKFPVYPPVKLLLPDSLTWFTKTDLPKKRPVMLLLFNPKCEHCQHETEEMTMHIEKFKGVHIVMATTASFDEMLGFREKYKLMLFDNITVGRDTGFFLPVFFDIRNLPFHAFYNKKLEMTAVFPGSMTLEKTIAELDK